MVFPFCTTEHLRKNFQNKTSAHKQSKTYTVTFVSFSNSFYSGAKFVKIVPLQFSCFVFSMSFNFKTMSFEIFLQSLQIGSKSSSKIGFSHLEMSSKRAQSFMYANNLSLNLRLSRTFSLACRTVRVHCLYDTVHNPALRERLADGTLLAIINTHAQFFCQREQKQNL